MANYVDFVLCTRIQGGAQTLYYAPAFSHIEKGDLVLVETEDGKSTSDVVASVTVDTKDQAMIDMIMRLYGAKPDTLKRVSARVTFHELDYSELDEERG